MNKKEKYQATPQSQPRANSGHSDHSNHDHHHHHHHHNHLLPTKDGRLDKVFYWAIALNLGYVILEAIFGWMNGSMGLLSDAGHNLSDVASLLIALLAFKAASRPATPSFSYGYGKATVGASLVNAVILYVAVIFICIESVERLFRPTPVDGAEVAWVAGVGVIINGVTAWMLMSHSHDDLNVKGAVINFTGWNWIDPVVGIVIAIMIAIGSWSLLRESLRLALDGVPANVDMEKIEEAIISVPEVKSFHHLHVWAMSTTRNALTVHVIVGSPENIDAAIEGVRSALISVGIDHSTIEAETIDHGCGPSGLDV